VLSAPSRLHAGAQAVKSACASPRGPWAEDVPRLRWRLPDQRDAALGAFGIGVRAGRKVNFTDYAVPPAPACPSPTQAGWPMALRWGDGCCGSSRSDFGRVC